MYRWVVVVSWMDHGLDCGGSIQITQALSMWNPKIINMLDVSTPVRDHTPGI